MDALSDLVRVEPIELHAGDVIVFPHGDPHMMSSEQSRRAAEHTSSHPDHADLLRLGGDRPRTVTGLQSCSREEVPA